MMADGDNNEQALYFPVLAGSWEPYAPPHTMGPEGPGLFRDELNLIARYGTLRKRPVIGASTLSTQPSSNVDLLAAAASRFGEIPIWIWSGIGLSNDPLYIVVTSKQAYAYTGGSWSNITPTYTTGTVAATNGSLAVVGTGTAWSTRHITKDQFILIEGVWYRIALVNSDTSITLSNNFGGTTGGGKAYTIRRTWGGGVALSVRSQIFCKYFNNDLFIAGAYLGGADGNLAPAVIKATGVISGSSYLTGNYAFTVGLDIIGNLLHISGLDVLQIGSVVFTGMDTSGLGGIFYYSSNLDDTVWTTSPGGFEPVYMKSGQINAMGALGGNLTLHYSDGVVLAIPVAKAEPPVAFQRTDAAVGCYAPRTLRNCFGGERFVAADGRYYVFDGANSVMQGQPPYVTLGPLSQTQLKLMTWSASDAANSEYWIFYNTDETDAATARKTVAICHQVANNYWSKHQFPVHVGYVAPLVSSASGSTSAAVVGVGNYDAETASQKASMIFEWFEDNGTGTDSIAYGSGSAGGNYFVTDDLDFGMPYKYKSVSRILLWVVGVASATETLRVYLRPDESGTLYGDTSKSFVVATGIEKLIQFTFAPVSIKHVRIFVGSSSNEILRCRPIRMAVYFEVGAEIASVEAL